MKMRTFYKKLPLFIKKKLNFAYLVKTQTSNMSFYKKNSIFGNNRDPWVGVRHKLLCQGEAGRRIQ